MMMIVWILAIVCCAYQAAAQQSEITQEIKLSPEVLRIGDTAHLICVVSYQNMNPVEWIFLSRNDSLTLNDRVWTSNQMNTNGMKKYEVIMEQKDQETSYTLVINNLQELDNGVYTCRIRFMGDTRYTERSRKLVVQIPPKIMQSQTTSVVTIQIGRTANITCSSIGVPKPTIKWRRVDGKLLPNGELIYVGATLILTNVTKADRGLYRCVADNQVPPQNPNDNVYDTLLDVQFPPLTKTFQPYYAQRENFRMQMDCSIEGNPPPRIVWYRSDRRCDNQYAMCNGTCGGFKDLRTDQFYDLQEHITLGSYLQQWVRRAVIIINFVRGGDFTYYYCCGYNDHGCSCDITQLANAFECQGVYCRGLGISAAPVVRSERLAIVSALVVLIAATFLRV